jgi:N utilization substance protein B
MKQLKAMKPIMDDNFYVPKVYKDNEDKAFVKDLFRKTILRQSWQRSLLIKHRTGSDRIAEVYYYS